MCAFAWDYVCTILSIWTHCIFPKPWKKKKIHLKAVDLVLVTFMHWIHLSFLYKSKRKKKFLFILVFPSQLFIIAHFLMRQHSMILSHEVYSPLFFFSFKPMTSRGEEGKKLFSSTKIFLIAKVNQQFFFKRGSKK